MKADHSILIITITLIIFIVIATLVYRLGIAEGELIAIDKWMKVYPVAPEYSEPENVKGFE